MDKLTMYVCFLWIVRSRGNLVTPSCTISDTTCEFRLKLEAQQMMTFANKTSEFSLFDEYVSFLSNGSVTVRKRHCSMEETLLTEEEAATIQSGDGLFKVAYLFNGRLPGPEIVVYTGQQVVVHVTNALTNEGTTVHWHGVDQHNTPWMDGVERLSQCTINPSHTFTYRFLASRPGTFWYHTHTSTQRTMGAYGALIVLNRNISEENNRRMRDRIPDMDKEFYMIVSDWFVKSSSEISEIVKNKAFGYMDGWDIKSNECFKSTKAPDGIDAGVIPYHSGLINGKGYHYKSGDSNPVNATNPLEKFTVEKGKKYRFRMISSAMTFVFKVSIDSHKLHVISTDGNDVVTKVVDYIIISSGERYDFWINASDPDKSGRYWIRAETLETYNSQHQKMNPHHTKAILQYSTTKPQVSKYPTSSPSTCTSTQPCLALNCPFRWYGRNNNITCIPVSELDNADATIDIQSNRTTNTREFVEYFLNYHSMLKLAYKKQELYWSPTINGIKNELPAVPFQVYPEKEPEYRRLCRCPKCVYCPCTHMVDVPLGSTVQLVLAVTVKNPPGVFNGNPHNVHLHGHRFKVIKTGFAVYDKKTLFSTRHSPDLECIGDFCNRFSWSNKSWLGGHVPVDKQTAPYKDTILIPVGGYVVVQFQADYPGYWYMHCHTEFHNEEGMSMVFKVGNVSEMSSAPSDMATCDNQNWINKLDKAPKKRVYRRAARAVTDGQSCEDRLDMYKGVTLVLVLTTVILLFGDVYLSSQNIYLHENGYSRLYTS